MQMATSLKFTFEEEKMELTEGMVAPDFGLTDTEGNYVKLSSFIGRPVVLYFYPKDDTPGCTTEACGFRDSMKKFGKKGAVVLGVSLDDMDSHRKFTDKHGLNFPLLCDTDAEVSRKYGVYVRKSMYGREFMGIERTTFIIGGDGLIKVIFRKVKPEGHDRHVLDALG